MGKLRQLLNSLLKKQEKIIDDLQRHDAIDEKECNKLIFLKDCERELDYLEDISKFYGV